MPKVGASILPIMQRSEERGMSEQHTRDLNHPLENHWRKRPCSEWDEYTWLNPSWQCCFVSGNHTAGSAEKAIGHCSDQGCDYHADFPSVCSSLTGWSVWSVMPGPARWNLAWHLPLDNWEAAQVVWGWKYCLSITDLPFTEPMKVYWRW